MKMLLRTIPWILCIILVILPTLARRPSPPPPRRQPSPPPPRRPPSPPPPRRPLSPPPPPRRPLSPPPPPRRPPSPPPPPPRRPPSPPPPPPPRSPPPPPPPRDIPYTEDWTLASSTPESYTELIASLRNGVKASEYCGIPVTSKTTKEFIFLETTSLKNKKVTLIFRATNFYYVGFMDELNRVSRVNFIKEDFNELKDNDLFRNTNIKTKLPHGGNYIDLQKVANLNGGRRELKLGVNSLSPLLDKISGSDYDGKNKPANIGQDLAKFALVAIQMIAEATRFKYIEEQVRDLGTSHGTFYPDSTFLSLQNDWDMISSLIYKTTKTDKGVIDCSIKVPVAKYSSLYPGDIKPAMGLLLYNKDG